MQDRGSCWPAVPLIRLLSLHACVQAGCAVGAGEVEEEGMALDSEM